MKKHRGLRGQHARRDIIYALLNGEVAYCFLSTGQRKVIYPTEELAGKAAKRLNRHPTSRRPGEPYPCDRGPHWHLRAERYDTSDESENSP
jgi:hypothetical protein